MKNIHIINTKIQNLNVMIRLMKKLFNLFQKYSIFTKSELNVKVLFYKIKTNSEVDSWSYSKQ